MEGGGSGPYLELATLYTASGKVELHRPQRGYSDKTQHMWRGAQKEAEDGRKEVVVLGSGSNWRGRLCVPSKDEAFAAWATNLLLGSTSQHRSDGATERTRASLFGRLAHYGATDTHTHTTHKHTHTHTHTHPCQQRSKQAVTGFHTHRYSFLFGLTIPLTTSS